MSINRNDILIFDDGFEIPRWLYNDIISQVRAALKVWTDDVCLTLKMMSDRDFWRQLTQGEQRLVGKCVPHMVINGVLPLSFAGKDKANALKYRNNKWS